MPLKNTSRVTESDIVETLFYCFTISKFTSVFHDSRLKRPVRHLSYTGNALDLCNAIYAQFETAFLKHYLGKSILCLTKPYTRRDAYGIVKYSCCSGSKEIETCIIESNNVDFDAFLQVSFDSLTLPSIYIHAFNYNELVWSFDLGSGHAERFSTKDDSNLLDMVLGGAHGQ